MHTQRSCITIHDFHMAPKTDELNTMRDYIVTLNGQALGDGILNIEMHLSVEHPTAVIDYSAQHTPQNVLSMIFHNLAE